MSDEKDAKGAPKAHRADGYAQKIDATADALQHKRQEHGLQKKPSSKPAGGFDETPIPSAPPGYTVKFTFHRAHHLPFGDLNTLASDPFLVAQLNTRYTPRHKQDPKLRFRSRTIQKTVEPVWNQEWIVANVPASGSVLKVRVYDEDPADHDDLLGKVHIPVDGLSEGWPGIKEETFKVAKRQGSLRAYFFRGCVAVFNRGMPMTGELVVSAEVLGKTETNEGGRVWTVGPCTWARHTSPMIGFLAGTKGPSEGKADGNQKKKRRAETYDFQANQMQLQGPVPAPMYHRYVEFKPFIAGMFEAQSFRGWILNRALHHQHNRIYNYDRHTLYGSFPTPSPDMTLKFLDLVHYDKGGRIFTYVITLDGQWRFTETGKEFGIDFLSKHTMHSDVNIYIAFSGEFFIRRLQRPHRDSEGKNNSVNPDDQPTHPPQEIDGGPPSNDPPKDPAYYTLVIDNDSGTYRPNATLLAQLKEFMQRQLPGLHVVTLDCNGDKEKMEKWKTEQRKRKRAEGKHIVVRQSSSGSFSSSDEESLRGQAEKYEATQDGPDGNSAGSGSNPEKDKDDAHASSALQNVKEKVAGMKDKIKENEDGVKEREERETQDDQELNGDAKEPQPQPQPQHPAAPAAAS